MNTESVPCNAIIDSVWTTFHIDPDDFLRLQQIYDAGKKALDAEN